MNDEDFLGELKEDWKKDNDKLPVSPKIIDRKLLKIRVAKLVEYGGAALAFVTSVFMWFRGEALLFKLSSVVLLLTAIVVLVVGRRLRRSLEIWGDWSPEGMLGFRLKACESNLLNLKYGIYAAWFLLCFVVSLWLLARFVPGAMVEGFEILYSIFTVPIALLTMMICKARVKTLRREKTALQQAVDAYRQAAD